MMIINDSTHKVEWKNKREEWIAFPHEFRTADEALAHIEEVVELVPMYRLKTYRITSIATREISF